MMYSNEEVTEINRFGVHITIFKSGNVYLATSGDIHIIRAKNVFEDCVDMIIQ